MLINDSGWFVMPDFQQTEERLSILRELDLSESSLERAANQLNEAGSNYGPTLLDCAQVVAGIKELLVIAWLNQDAAKVNPYASAPAGKSKHH